jgi:hypothetical protein
VVRSPFSDRLFYLFVCREFAGPRPGHELRQFTIRRETKRDQRSEIEFRGFASYIGRQQVVKPDRFFKPAYVGPSGWIGVYLDDSPDWDEVFELLRDGWKMIAPKKLLNPKAEVGMQKSDVQRPKSRVSARSKASTSTRKKQRTR